MLVSSSVDTWILSFLRVDGFLYSRRCQILVLGIHIIFFLSFSSCARKRCYRIIHPHSVSHLPFLHFSFRNITLFRHLLDVVFSISVFYCLDSISLDWGNVQTYDSAESYLLLCCFFLFSSSLPCHYLFHRQPITLTSLSHLSLLENPIATYLVSREISHRFFSQFYFFSS